MKFKSVLIFIGFLIFSDEIHSGKLYIFSNNKNDVYLKIIGTRFDCNEIKLFTLPIKILESEDFVIGTLKIPASNNSNIFIMEYKEISDQRIISIQCKDEKVLLELKENSNTLTIGSDINEICMGKYENI